MLVLLINVQSNIAQKFGSVNNVQSNIALKFGSVNKCTVQYSF